MLKSNGPNSISKDALKDEGCPWLINYTIQEYLVNVGQDSHFNSILHQKNKLERHMSEWRGVLTYRLDKDFKFLIKSREELTLYISPIRLHMYKQTLWNCRVLLRDREKLQ